MIKLLIIITLTFSSMAMAHEGGHGELAEGGKFGGITSPVVDKTQAGKGNKAKFLYKAELVRAENGTLSLYLFDSHMKLLALDPFSDKVEAKLEVKRKGKFEYFGSFTFKKAGKHYTAQLPKVEHKPFNIDLFFNRGKQELFIGFSNLD